MALLFNGPMLLKSGDLANVTGHERKPYLPQSRLVLAAFFRKVRLRLEQAWRYFSTGFQGNLRKEGVKDDQ